MKGFQISEDEFRRLRERDGETVKNSRIRASEQTLFEALMSDEARLEPEMEAKLRDLDNSLASYELNAKIVLFIFVEVLKFHATKIGGRLKLNNKGNQLDNLYYAFRYRNIGRAAMMHLAELSVT